MNRNNPLVTVYITNYNYGVFISQAIESVSGQTFKDFELIIIDDGSTDESKEIIKHYEGLPFVKTVFQKNKGLNASNNVAMNMARGKYIMRLDADDFLAPSALGIMSAVLEAEPDTALVFPDFYYVDINGKITGEECRHNFDREVTLFDLPAHGACTMIRLNILKKIGGYNENIKCQDGYDLWIKLATKYKVSNINKPLFYYRKHGKSITSNEERILIARKKIKEQYAHNLNFETPKCFCVIPVRVREINGVIWPLEPVINSISPLERIISEIKKSKTIKKIIVTSSNEDVEKLVEKLTDEKLTFVKRPPEYEEYQKSLRATYEMLLKHKQAFLNEADLFLNFAPEFPFVTHEDIDEAIYTSIIFKADSVVGVRPDNETYYQHDGSGLYPILDQGQHTKYERDILYKGIKAISLTRKEVFLKTGRLLKGKLSHIVLSPKAALEINTNFNLNLYQLLLN